MKVFKGRNFAAVPSREVVSCDYTAYYAFGGSEINGGLKAVTVKRKLLQYLIE